MSIRSILFVLAAGLVGITSAAAEPAGTGSHNGVFTPFQCENKTSVQVACVGKILILPINVDIKDVRILTDNELSILEDSLNHVAILNGDILNHNKILNDLKLSVLTDFLSKVDLDITDNDVDVCTAVLGLPLCK